MKAGYYKTRNGKNHNIDYAGNHFVNGKCVNPLVNEGNIGDTHPKETDIINPLNS